MSFVYVIFNVYLKVHVYKKTHLFKNSLCVNLVVHVSHICIQWNFPRTTSYLGENPWENFLTRGFVRTFYVSCIVISTCKYFVEPSKLKNQWWFRISQDIIELQCLFYIKRRSYLVYLMRKTKSTVMNWLTILHLELKINSV